MESEAPSDEERAPQPRSPVVVLAALVGVVAAAVGLAYWLWVTGLAVGVDQLDRLTAMSAGESGGLSEDVGDAGTTTDIGAHAADTAVPIDGAADRAEALLARIREHYAGFPGLEAQITQRFDDPLVEETTVNEGRIYFEPPGQFRMDFVESSDPEARERVMLREGDFLWIYETHYHKAAKTCFDTSWPAYALALLLEPDAIEERFEIKSPGPSTLLLEPRGAGADFETIRLSFDPDTYDLTEAELVDAYDITTRLNFTDVELTDVPDHRFDIETAGGFEVLNPRKRCP